jgi:hypothetical protein
LQTSSKILWTGNQPVSRLLHIFYLIRILGVESSWVHSAWWPLVGLLYLPRMIMMLEHLVE